MGGHTRSRVYTYVVLMMVVVVVVALLPLVYEYLQPKEIKEIKEFLLTARRKDARCT